MLSAVSKAACLMEQKVDPFHFITDYYQKHFFLHTFLNYLTFPTAVNKSKALSKKKGKYPVSVSHAGLQSVCQIISFSLMKLLNGIPVCQPTEQATCVNSARAPIEHILQYRLSQQASHMFWVREALEGSLKRHSPVISESSLLWLGSQNSPYPSLQKPVDGRNY